MRPTSAEARRGPRAAPRPGASRLPTRVVVTLLLATAVAVGSAALAPGPPAALAAEDVPEVLAAPDQPAPPEEVDAAGAVLWDPTDERALWGREADRARPIASLTKMLTTLLAVERIGDLDATVTVSETAASTGGATVALRAGQEVPLRSLVAGLMVESGNDAAVAVAEQVAGSEAAFVELMHARARELGLSDDAAFVNASGLTDDASHRATPTDVARLGTAAMAVPIIERFAGAATATVEGLPPLRNRNELLGSYAGADGIKTGFTELSGPTIAASASRGGWRLIAVALDSDDRGRDTATMLDWGFDAFDRLAAVDEGASLGRFAPGVPLVADRALAVTAPAQASASWRLRLLPQAAAVGDGTELGLAELVVDGETVQSVPVRAVGAPPADETASGHDRHRTHQQAGEAVADALRGLARAAPLPLGAPQRLTGDPGP